MCTIKNCNEKEYDNLRGYCLMHYRAYIIYGDPNVKMCAASGCSTKTIEGSKYCGKHTRLNYSEDNKRTKKVVCTAKGCGSAQFKNGFCEPLGN